MKQRKVAVISKCQFKKITKIKAKTQIQKLSDKSNILCKSWNLKFHNRFVKLEKHNKHSKSQNELTNYIV